MLVESIRGRCVLIEFARWRHRSATAPRAPEAKYVMLRHKRGGCDLGGLWPGGYVRTPLSSIALGIFMKFGIDGLWIREELIYFRKVRDSVGVMGIVDSPVVDRYVKKRQRSWENQLRCSAEKCRPLYLLLCSPVATLCRFQWRFALHRHRNRCGRLGSLLQSGGLTPSLLH